MSCIKSPKIRHDSDGFERVISAIMTKIMLEVCVGLQ